MWWWLTATASGTTVIPHRCTIDETYRSSAVCGCLGADPDGPKWWGGVGDPPAVEETCFDVDAVMAVSPPDARLRELLGTRASQIALDHRYRWVPGYGLVSQEDKNQLDYHAVRLAWTGQGWTMSGWTGKVLGTLDLGGRIPWPTALLVDADDEDSADTGGDDKGEEDDVVVMLTSGEVWVVLGPFAPDETIPLPKP